MRVLSTRQRSVLHEVSTFDADNNIRAVITERGETKLMTRVVGGFIAS